MKNFEGFYPTPTHLIEKMIKGIDFSKINTILEPSAGKGDIADVIYDRMRQRHHKSHYDKYVCNMDTVEINPDLRHILSGKGHRVVYDNFLEFSTYKHYDLIIMNPPFDTGEKHLMKAIEMQKNGGSIVCVLNKDTLHNPYSYPRKELIEVLNNHNAEIIYLDDEFKLAERKTNVSIALIKIDIPYTEPRSVIIECLKKEMANEESNEETFKTVAVAEDDYIDVAITQFKFEVAAGLQLIKDYKALLPILSSSLGDKSWGTLLKLTTGEHNSYSTPSENVFIGSVRVKYWKALFMNPKFTKSITSNLLSKCNEDIGKLVDYDFNRYNIKSVCLKLSQEFITATEDTIVKLFDKLSSEHHWNQETSKNRHYFNGWATNSAWKINKKVILPMNLHGYIVGGFEDYDYRAFEVLDDIIKTLRFLDNNNGEDVSVRNVLNEIRDTTKTTKTKGLSPVGTLFEDHFICRYISIGQDKN